MPALAMASAMPRPMPLVEPVMIAVLPLVMESPLTFSRSRTDQPVLVVLFLNRRSDDGKTRGRRRSPIYRSPYPV